MYTAECIPVKRQCLFAGIFICAAKPRTGGFSKKTGKIAQNRIGFVTTAAISDAEICYILCFFRNNRRDC